MHSMIKKAMITTAAAATAIGLGIGPAGATTVTVFGGPAYIAMSTGSVTLLGVTTCTSSTLSGTVTPGSYSVPAQIGAVTSSTWTGCIGFGSLPAFVTLVGTSWQFWVSGAQSGGVTPVEMRNINAVVSVPSIGCMMAATGSVSATFANSTQALSFPGTPTLVVATSGFCPGVSSAGGLQGAYRVAGSPSAITML